MTENTWERVKRLLQEAMERPTEERAAFLDGACEDPALRAEVAELLEAHQNAEGFLEATQARSGGTVGAEQPGTTIGRYKLLQLIGEGGFGSVYMAEQERPVRRKVALKVIKLGMDTRQVIARFEAERQALALMDHPNIARVLDAGSTDTGRPYFVMELVRGVPITEYCDANGLSMSERLELFQSVCSAVQHAHQKGIIHRDIKPSNVMVTLHDGTPVPKVIDFGIAKATNQRLTEKTLFTEYRQFIGTPQYMSPEQAEMSGLDVDTRTDIYSLGVLLYELLTGTTPFDPGRLRSMAFSEIHRVIREEDPHKPSTRVSTLGDDATDTAKHRRTDVRTLRRALAGDLDWIVMKALEKDRTRRYDTANALLLDIRRHLDDEPVVAGPPGAAYRMGKFFRRNRTAVSVAAAVTIAVLAGLGLATYGFWQASRGREIAAEAAASAEAVNAFFDDMLASINPDQLHLHSPFGSAGIAADATAQFSHDVSVAEMLERAAKRVGSSFEDQPLLEASMRETLGTTLLGLEKHDEALTQFERSYEIRRDVLGEDDRETLRSRVHVATALADAKRDAPSIEASWAVIHDIERVFGEEDPLSMYMASVLGEKLGDQGRTTLADSLHEVTLERQRRVLGSDHRDTILTLRNWAGNWCWRGNGEEAERFASEAYERAIQAYSPDDAVVLATESRLGLALAFLGQDVRAQEILRPSLEKHRRLYGDQHAACDMVRFALARACNRLHEIDERISLYRERTSSPVDWVPQRDLALTLVQYRGVDEGLALFREQYEFWRDPPDSVVRSVTDSRLRTIQGGTLGMYRNALATLGRWNQVRALERERIEHLRAAAEAPDAGFAEWSDLAWELVIVEPADLREPAEALVWAERVLDAEDLEPISRGNVLDTAARAHFLDGQPQRALEWEQRAVEVAAVEGPEDDWGIALLLGQLVRYEIEWGEPGAAAAAVERRVAQLESGDRTLSEMAVGLRHVGNELSKLGLHGLAAEPLRLAVERARESRDERILLEALIARAESLARGGDPAAASPLLDEATRLYRQCWVTAPIDWCEGLGIEPRSDGERSRNGNRVKADLARALFEAGRIPEAEELSFQVRCVNSSTYGALSPQLLAATGATEEAERAWRVLAFGGQYLGSSDPPRRARFESEYARFLMEQGRWGEAERWIRHAHDVLADWCGPTSVDTRRAARRLDAWERREL